MVCRRHVRRAACRVRSGGAASGLQWERGQQPPAVEPGWPSWARRRRPQAAAARGSDRAAWRRAPTGAAAGRGAVNRGHRCRAALLWPQSDIDWSQRLDSALNGTATRCSRPGTRSWTTMTSRWRRPGFDRAPAPAPADGSPAPPPAARHQLPYAVASTRSPAAPVMAATARNRSAWHPRAARGTVPPAPRSRAATSAVVPGPAVAHGCRRHRSAAAESPPHADLQLLRQLRGCARPNRPHAS